MAVRHSYVSSERPSAHDLTRKLHDDLSETRFGERGVIGPLDGSPFDAALPELADGTERELRVGDFAEDEPARERIAFAEDQTCRCRGRLVSEPFGKAAYPEGRVQQWGTNLQEVKGSCCSVCRRDVRVDHHRLGDHDVERRQRVVDDPMFGAHGECRLRRHASTVAPVCLLQQSRSALGREILRSLPRGG